MSRSRRAACVAGAALAVLVQVPAAGGGEVARTLDDGRLVRAEYHAGRADRAAVLLIHDFLATGRSRISRALSRRLAREKVDLLAPTLSLGIDARRQALPCEALHIHYLEQDVRELQGWIEWLLGRGRQRVVLISEGHGAWPALALLQQPLSTAVTALVMVSPRPPGVAGAAAAVRGTHVAEGRELRREPLWHCARYVAPADALLSYARWDPPRVLQALASSPRPVRAIAGARDSTLEAGWLASLSRAGVSVHTLPDSDDPGHPAHVDTLVELLVAALIIEG